MKNICNHKRKLNIAIEVIIVLLFVAVLTPFFVTTKYALFVTDDFPLANAVVREFDGSYFRTGLKCAANYWHVWNGNWFSFFIAYWLHPIVHGGQRALVLALRIHLILTIVGAGYFCFSLTRFFDLKADKALRIAIIVLLPIFSFKEYFDFYLWWLTSCTYLMPLYCLLYGLGTYLFALKSGKVWRFLVAGLFLLAMSGGSLNVVGMGCYALFFVLVAWCFYKKEICIPGCVVFVITLIGACINAFAPGNFTRQNGQESEKVGVFKAVVNEIQIMGVEGKWLIFHTAFVAFVLLALLWGIRLNKKISFRNLIFGSIASAILPIITMFPVILGYGDIEYKDISNRGQGMMDISIIFATCFIAVLWGVYLKDNLNGVFVKGIKCVAMIVALTSLLFCGQKPVEVVPAQITINLSNGYNEAFFNTWMEIYSLCENADEGDVIIEMSVLPRKTGCSWAKLGEETDKWWNTSISEYYGLNSISLINTFSD